MVPTRFLPWFNHLGIVVHKEGTVCVAHNIPQDKSNIWRQNVLIEPLDVFLGSKKVRGVISTNGRHTDEEIHQKVELLNKQDKKFSIFGYNCEDFVREVCGCSWGINQKKKTLMLFVYIALFGIIIYLILKK